MDAPSSVRRSDEPEEDPPPEDPEEPEDEVSDDGELSVDGFLVAGLDVSAGSGEGSVSIAPTPVSEWTPETGCSDALERGSATEVSSPVVVPSGSPVPSAVLVAAGSRSTRSAPPAPPASEASPTAMPGRSEVTSAWSTGSRASVTAASATATRIPTVRKVFMAGRLPARDETVVKSR